MKCIFCEINSNENVENSILYENDNFYIIPAKGPLIPGHVLIVSKKHSTSLMSIDYLIKESFTYIITKIIDNIAAYKEFLFFEHGSYKDEKAGKTIDHTHIHVLPGYNKSKNILEESYNIERRIKVNDIPSTTLYCAYLLIGDKNGVLIYNGIGMESQIIRKKIAESNKKLVPYWQDYDNTNALEETIKMWKDVKFKP